MTGTYHGTGAAHLRLVKTIDGPQSGSVTYDARATAQQWAQRLLDRAPRNDWVILDTETTGLDGLAEIVQIGVISATGDVLLDTLLHPTRPIPPDAIRIHGITDAACAGAPAYPAVHPQLEQALRGKTVISYNAKYDARLLRQTALIHRTSTVVAMWDCAMERYAQYVGRWSDRHGHFQFQALPRRGSARFAYHRALDDCRATLDLIHAMATGSL
jgi:DNA polymerase-3 subunit epsilon